jgi:hypothetical protein
MLYFLRNNGVVMEKSDINRYAFRVMCRTFLFLILFVLAFCVIWTFAMPYDFANFLYQVGANDFALVEYEHAYNQSKDINKLYNLLNKSILCNKNEYLIKYYDNFYNDSKYYDLIENVEKSNANLATSNALKVYVANEDNYFKVRYVAALLKNNYIDKAISFASSDMAKFSCNTIYCRFNFAYYGFVGNSNKETYLKVKNDFNGMYDYYINAKNIFDTNLDKTSSDDKLKLAILANSNIKVIDTLLDISNNVSDSSVYPWNEVSLKQDRTYFVQKLDSLLSA